MSLDNPYEKELSVSPVVAPSALAAPKTTKSEYGRAPSLDGGAAMYDRVPEELSSNTTNIYDRVQDVI